MNVLLASIDGTILLYGVIIALGIAGIIWRIMAVKPGQLILELIIFFVVFALHGGGYHGGFAAAIAVLIVGQVIGPMWYFMKRGFRRRLARHWLFGIFVKEK